MMNEKKIKIAIVINMMPSYRAGFYDELFSNKNIEATVYCHTPPNGSSLRPIHQNYGSQVKVCNAKYYGNDVVVISKLPWTKLLLKYDIVIVEGNPRYIVHALLATTLRLLGKPVILWTMAHSYRDRAFSQWIRIKWTKIFKNILVYSDKEVSYLRKLGFIKNKIVGINNGLNQKKIEQEISLWTESSLVNWKNKNNLENKTILLSCARLESKNKFHQFAEVLPNILLEFPNVVWCIIGAGSDESAIINAVKKNSVESNVRLLGSIHEESLLAPWFLSAYLMIHPAAIGLSILHSYGYGLPVITHSNASHHGPEFAVFEEGITGVSFGESNVNELLDTVLRQLRDVANQQKMKKSCREVAQFKFNTSKMAETFASLIEEVAQQK
jgi:glycosyltransferase involved in cell wall biosynthesis